MEWTSTSHHLPSGLNPTLRLQLSIYVDNVGLKKFIQHSIRLAQRMQNCLKEDPTLQSSLQHRQPEGPHSRTKTHAYLNVPHWKTPQADTEPVFILWVKWAFHCCLSHSSSMPHGQFSYKWIINIKPFYYYCNMDCSWFCNFIYCPHQLRVSW